MLILQNLTLLKLRRGRGMEILPNNGARENSCFRIAAQTDVPKRLHPRMFSKDQSVVRHTSYAGLTSVFSTISYGSSGTSPVPQGCSLSPWDLNQLLDQGWRQAGCSRLLRCSARTTRSGARLSKELRFQRAQ